MASMLSNMPLSECFFLSLAAAAGGIAKTKKASPGINNVVIFI
jgi:hypothetical protein